GRDIIAKKIILSLKSSPRRIDDETRQRDEHKQRLGPPHISPHGLAERPSCQRCCPIHLLCAPIRKVVLSEVEGSRDPTQGSATRFLDFARNDSDRVPARFICCLLLLRAVSPFSMLPSCREHPKDR